MTNNTVDRLVAAFDRLELPLWTVTVPADRATPLTKYLQLRGAKYVGVRINRNAGNPTARPESTVFIVAGQGEWQGGRAIDQAECQRLLRLWLQLRRPEEITLHGFGRHESRVVPPSETRAG